jgi:hypothetical protein
MLLYQLHLRIPLLLLKLLLKQPDNLAIIRAACVLETFSYLLIQFRGQIHRCLFDGWWLFAHNGIIRYCTVICQKAIGQYWFPFDIISCERLSHAEDRDLCLERGILFFLCSLARYPIAYCHPRFLDEEEEKKREGKGG